LAQAILAQVMRLKLRHSVDLFPPTRSQAMVLTSTPACSCIQGCFTAWPRRIRRGPLKASAAAGDLSLPTLLGQTRQREAASKQSSARGCDAFCSSEVPIPIDVMFDELTELIDSPTSTLTDSAFTDPFTEPLCSPTWADEALRCHVVEEPASAVGHSRPRFKEELVAGAPAHQSFTTSAWDTSASVGDRLLRAPQVLGREALEHGQVAAGHLARKTQEVAIASWPHLLDAADCTRRRAFDVTLAAGHIAAQMLKASWHKCTAEADADSDEEGGSSARRRPVVPQIKSSLQRLSFEENSEEGSSTAGRRPLVLQLKPSQRLSLEESIEEVCGVAPVQRDSVPISAMRRPSGVSAQVHLADLAPIQAPSRTALVAAPEIHVIRVTAEQLGYVPQQPLAAPLQLQPLVPIAQVAPPRAGSRRLVGIVG